MEKATLVTQSDTVFAAQDEDYVSMSDHEESKTGRLRVVSLFTGIGGFDLAFEKLGAKVVLQCERDPFCQSILKRHWPKTKLAKDIRELTPSNIPDADIWAAGFPCQDVSLARGNHGRSGLKGHHTSLFFDLIRLAAKKKPKVILLENVVGLLNSHRGADFAIILSELEKIGYAVSWRVLNARYFGAPQSRSRVFITAWLRDFRKSAASIFESTQGHVPEPARKGFLKKDRHKTSGAIVPGVAYCVAATSGRHTGNDWARSYVSYTDGVRRPTPTESERLQGFSENWTLPLAENGLSQRNYDAERYKSVGNAVAVPVVTWVANRIIAEMEIVRASSRSFEKDLYAIAPDLGNGGSCRDFEEVLTKLNEGAMAYRWKTGGCLWKGRVVESSAPPAPTEVIPSRFVDALDEGVPDRRYFITKNAAEGIIRRADSVGRTLFEPMRAALEKLVGCAG